MSTVHAAAARPLTTRERRVLHVLGLPTFALALSITVVSTYGPTVAREMTGSSTLIGLLIGGEGLGALLLPLPVGAWSDRLRTRWGGRIPFVVAGAPLAVVGLVGVGVAGSLGVLAVAVGVFFCGYFIAYEPYRAIYADVIDEDVAGRAQSTQAVWRGLGTGFALLGGGVLLAVGRTVPFAVAAVAVVVCIGVFARRMRHDRLLCGETPQGTAGDAIVRTLRALRGRRALQAFFVANALWELAIGALKTFVILWMTRGLGLSLELSSVIVGVVALPILAGAALSGRLADRFGRGRVVQAGALLFGLPMLVPLLTTASVLLAVVVPFIALGGGVLMALPYALMQPLMPVDRHGALTGLYSMSRGVGVVLGPLLGGVVVAAFGSVLSSTEGYAAVWGLCAAASLASIPLVGRIEAPGASQ